jgi:hypothetical protein
LSGDISWVKTLSIIETIKERKCENFTRETPVVFYSLPFTPSFARSR